MRIYMVHRVRPLVGQGTQQNKGNPIAHTGSLTSDRCRQREEGKEVDGEEETQRPNIHGHADGSHNCKLSLHGLL